MSFGGEVEGSPEECRCGKKPAGVVSGQICVSEGETVAASVRNCAIESVINMTMKRMTVARRSVSRQGNSRRSTSSEVEQTEGPPHSLPGTRTPGTTDDWLHDASQNCPWLRRRASCARSPGVEDGRSRSP